MDKAAKTVQVVGHGRYNRADKEDGLNRLREAADRIFSEKGYHSLSAEDITLAAKAARKTIYSHF